MTRILGDGVQNYTMRHFIVSPQSYYYRIWCFFMTFLACYTCSISLFQWSFLPSQTLGFFVFDNLVNLFFIVDIIAMFFVAYNDNNNFTMVDNRKRIAVKQLKIFVFSLILCFPFELVGLRFHDSTSTRILNTIRLVRFFRFIRVYKAFLEVESSDKFNFTCVRIGKLITTVCFVAHWGGCIFYYIATFHGLPGKTWIGTTKPNFLHQALWKKYVNSVYWSVVSLTTVGYGDWHPVTYGEQIFTTIYLLLNLVVGAYIVGYITNWMAPSMGKTEKYKERRCCAASFCQRNSIPPFMQNEIFSHLRLEYDPTTNFQGLQDHELIESLPKSLKIKVVNFLCKEMAKNSLFNEVSNETLLQMALAVEVGVYPQDACVIFQNEMPTCFYFVSSGSLDLILLEDEVELVVETVNSGGMIGETSVLINKPQFFIVKTKTVSQLIKIDRVKFFEILKMNTDDGSIVMNNHIEQLKELKDANRYFIRILEIVENKLAVGMMDLPVSLWFAAEKKNDLWFSRLLRNDGDPNAVDNEGRTALHILAARGDIEKIRSLRGYGANPNIKDMYGNLPLWNAMLGGHNNSILELKNVGATLRGGDIRAYACEAVAKHDMELLKAIVACGEDVNTPSNNYEDTALHVAVMENQLNIVRYLVERGAKVDTYNNDGYTPIGIARRLGYKDIESYLENYRSA